MSFLTFLLFASAIYFAQARPDAGTPHVAGTPAAASGPAATAADNKNQAEGFMSMIREAVDKYLTPSISHLDDNTQKKLRNMMENGAGGYFNYVKSLGQSKQSDVDSKLNPSPFGFNGDDIIVEILTSVLPPENSPLVPAVPEPPKQPAVAAAPTGGHKHSH